MKFKDLFKKDMTPNWAFIFSIPEFKRMKDTKQSNVYHKEGNVDIHTKLVTKEMQKFLDDILVVNKNSQYYLIMMCAAICHDLGKPTTTKFDEKTQEYTSPYHGIEGDSICRQLFYDEKLHLREKVCYMVRNHMKPFYLDKNDSLYANIIKLSWGYMPIKDLLILNYCDSMGSKTDTTNKTEIKDTLRRYKECADRINCLETAYEFDNKKQRLQSFYDRDGIISQNNHSNFRIYVMIGLPGAGKDTWIMNNLRESIPILSRDDIRNEIGITGSKPMGNKQQEDNVTKIINERIIKYCQNNTSFVLNNTNLKKRYRDELHKMLLPYNPIIYYVYVEAPSVQDNIERRKGQVKASIINRMLKDFEFPELYEYDKLIIYKQENDK